MGVDFGQDWGIPWPRGQQRVRPCRHCRGTCSGCCGGSASSLQTYTLAQHEIRGLVKARHQLALSQQPRLATQRRRVLHINLSSSCSLIVIADGCAFSDAAEIFSAVTPLSLCMQTLSLTLSSCPWHLLAQLMWLGAEVSGRKNLSPHSLGNPAALYSFCLVSIGCCQYFFRVAGRLGNLIKLPRLIIPMSLEAAGR